MKKIIVQQKLTFEQAVKIAEAKGYTVVMVQSEKDGTTTIVCV